MKKRLGCGFLSLILLILGTIYTINNVVPYLIIRPWKHAATENPAEFGLKFENVCLQGFENITLKGWLILAKGETTSQKCLIFCHGISRNRAHFLESAAKASAEGWNCLLLDGRAHGESDGEYCTFGYFEEKDMESAIDFLEKRFPTQPKIGIWGASLGGAIGLQCLENDKRIDFGIIESTFMDLPTIVSDYQKNAFLGIRIGRASQKALKKAGEIAHFDPQTVRPGEAAKNIQQPVMIIHGTADEKISFEYGRQIFKNLASQKKDFVPVSGAHHRDVHRVGGSDLEQIIFDFLSQMSAMKDSVELEK